VLLLAQRAFDAVRAAWSQPVGVHRRLAFFSGHRQTNGSLGKHNGIHAADPIPLNAVEQENVVTGKLADLAELIPAAIPQFVPTDLAHIPSARHDGYQLADASIVAAHLDR